MYIHVHNHMSSKDMWKWKLLACNIRLAIGLSKFFYIVGVIARWILHKLKILYIKKFIIIHRPRLSYRQSPSPAAWATCSFWQLFSYPEGVEVLLRQRRQRRQGVSPLFFCRRNFLERHSAINGNIKFQIYTGNIFFFNTLVTLNVKTKIDASYPKLIVFLYRRKCNNSTEII